MLFKICTVLLRKTKNFKKGRVFRKFFVLQVFVRIIWDVMSLLPNLAKVSSYLDSAEWVFNSMCVHDLLTLNSEVGVYFFASTLMVRRLLEKIVVWFILSCSSFATKRKLSSFEIETAPSIFVWKRQSENRKEKLAFEFFPRTSHSHNGCGNRCEKKRFCEKIVVDKKRLRYEMVAHYWLPTTVAMENGCA